MSLLKESGVCLLGSGLCLLLLGGFTTYLLLPSTASIPIAEPPVATGGEVSEGSDMIMGNGVVPELPTAPEGYAWQWQDFTERIALPEPDRVGSMSVATALQERRSERSFAATNLALEDLGQMLWAGVGVTDAENGWRTVPSRGEAYPINFFVVVDRVDGIAPGLYGYIPETHELGLIEVGGQSHVWADITGQPHPANAAAVILMSLNMSRGEGFRQTNYQESGHVGQNLYLQAQERGLNMLVMGGFDAAEAHKYLDLDEYQQVVYLVPIGNPGAAN